MSSGSQGGSGEPWQWSAASIAAHVRAGTVSAQDVTRSCLDRLAAVNPALGAVVEVDETAALEAAAAVDAAVKAGDPSGSLAGVPLITKVNVDQRGSATTNGVSAFQDRIASHDNPVIANLRQAGAVIIGRSSTPAFSWRWFTDSELYGPTLNPWNAAATAGGSSGGSAVAVAAGIVPIAHGSDLAGSIRVPAMACGVFGMRPSQGRVPSFDASAPADRPPFAQLLGSQGPLARSVEDLRLALEAMTPYRPSDAWAVPVDNVSVLTSRQDGPRRVGVLREVPWADVDPTVAKQVDLAADRLAAAGYEVLEVSHDLLEGAYDIYRALLWEARHGLLPLIERHGDTASREVATNFWDLSADMSAADYFAQFGARTALIRRWQEVLTELPLIVLPVSWQRPFPADFDRRGRDAVMQVIAAMQPSVVVNLCGLPAVAAPTSWDEDGPLGVQVVAGRFDEERCLQAAEVIADHIAAPIAPCE